MLEKGYEKLSWPLFRDNKLKMIAVARLQSIADSEGDCLIVVPNFFEEASDLH